MYFYFYDYVFSLYVYVWLPWLRFFPAFSSVVRQMPGQNPQTQGTARTLPNFWVVLCIFCVLLCIFVLLYGLFCDVLCIVCVYMCTVLLPPGGYPIAVKYIIYHIIYRIISYIISHIISYISYHIIISYLRNPLFCRISKIHESHY
jgi:magnesium-transporting ATPase (P-type)